jgi:hypothetical protein
MHKLRYKSRQRSARTGSQCDRRDPISPDSSPRPGILVEPWKGGALSPSTSWRPKGGWQRDMAVPMFSSSLELWLDSGLFRTPSTIHRRRYVTDHRATLALECLSGMGRMGRKLACYLHFPAEYPPTTLSHAVKSRPLGDCGPSGVCLTGSLDAPTGCGMDCHGLPYDYWGVDAKKQKRSEALR